MVCNAMSDPIILARKKGLLERIGLHPSFVLCKIVVRQIVSKDAAEHPFRLYAKIALKCSHRK